MYDMPIVALWAEQAPQNTTYGLSTRVFISLKVFLRIVLTQAVYRLIIGVASE